MKKRLFVLILIHLLITGVALGVDKILEVKVDKTIDEGLAYFIERSYEKAESEGFDYVLINMNTPGGRIDSSIKIKNVILNSDIKTICYINGQALSAGTLIALSSDHIGMTIGSTLGDAEPRIGTEIADEKILSAWKKELASAAEAKERNSEIAAAFADRAEVIEGIKEEGRLLTLTTQEAKDLEMIEYIVDSKEDLLSQLDISDYEIEENQLTQGEKLARFLTNPVVAPILLMIGITGIILEVFTAGFGFFGILGLVALVLFFGGHIFAGVSSWLVILIFVLGLIFMMIEVFVPGFGVFGIIGIILFVASIFAVSPSMEAAIRSLAIAIIGSIVISGISFKFLKKSRLWSRLILQNQLTSKEGYVGAEDKKEYLNLEGTAITKLRPAGTMILEDGTKLSVVTEGDFVDKDTRVKIVSVEGNRIVVRKLI